MSGWAAQCNQAGRALLARAGLWLPIGLLGTVVACAGMTIFSLFRVGQSPNLHVMQALPDLRRYEP